jgi:hypothetical protein
MAKGEKKDVDAPKNVVLETVATGFSTAAGTEAMTALKLSGIGELTGLGNLTSGAIPLQQHNPED